MIAMTKEQWSPISKRIGHISIHKGAHVVVTCGKNYGKQGVVFWHGRDKFAGREYGGEWSLAVRDMIGKSGFRAGINTGTEKFFVNADNLEKVFTL